MSSKHVAVLLAAAVAVGVSAPIADAHETDQYSLPLDKPFADLGDLLDASHLKALERAVLRANREIEEALREKQTPAIRKRLDALQSQDYLVEGVYKAFNDAFTDVLDLESAAKGSWSRKAFPDMYTRFDPPRWIYDEAHAWLDPRRLITIWHSGTVKAYGVYFGSDKISHFHHMGHFYYTTWRDNRAAGMSEAEAVANVIERYSGGGPLGENGLLGHVVTGVYSNADLVANYTGFKFYRNLTEPMMLNGRKREPLCVRVGEFWAINTHVRPESGWFGAFVSDHWNEAFNPSLYDSTIRVDMKRAIEKRADNVLKFWTQRDGRPSDPAYYEKLAKDLSTYFGEPYGYSGEEDKLFTIANTVIPVVRSARP